MVGHNDQIYNWKLFYCKIKTYKTRTWHVSQTLIVGKTAGNIAWWLRKLLSNVFNQRLTNISLLYMMAILSVTTPYCLIARQIHSFYSEGKGSRIWGCHWKITLTTLRSFLYLFGDSNQMEYFTRRVIKYRENGRKTIS